jgi:hypothetical protein
MVSVELSDKIVETLREIGREYDIESLDDVIKFLLEVYRRALEVEIELDSVLRR